MNIKNFFTGVLLLCAFSATAQKVPFADPCILLYENKYYAYGTGDDNGIPVYVSNDLRYWEKQPNLALHKNDTYTDRWFWAPDVAHINGKFYMCFSGNQRICIASADSPLGPFRQEVKKPLIEDVIAVDNCLFVDNDGKVYMFYSPVINREQEIWMAEMEENMTDLKHGTIKKCFGATEPWEMVRTPVIVEGPYVIKHKGIYYMTYSGNGYEDYEIGVATATDINGPWTKYENNPIYPFRVGDVKAPGHNALFYDKENNLKMVFHAHKDESNIHPRESYITSVEFVSQPDGIDIMTVSPDWQPMYIVVASGACGDNLTWKQTGDSILTIQGKGAMNDWTNGTQPWSAYRLRIKNAIIGDFVTTIGNNAFRSCSNLTESTIPISVISIGESAFSSCRGLSSVIIPASVVSIEESAFAGCAGLTDIYVSWTEPPRIKNTVFSNIDVRKIKLHIPQGTLQAYQNADIWKDFLLVDGATAINEIEIKTLKIYPNPATEKLTIENGELTIENVELFDTSGRKIFNFQLSIFNSIDITALPKGIYFVRTGNFTGKFVKN